MKDKLSNMTGDQLKEYIMMAVQSTKSENSGLITDLKTKFGLDHDLLIEIHGIVKRQAEDIKGINETLSGRPTKEEWEDMKKDVKWLQIMAYGGLGIIGFIEFATRLYPLVDNV